MAKQVSKNQKVAAKRSAPSRTADNLNTGISEENSKNVADSLNEVLADEFLLYTKTLNFHWNIEGRDFHALHLFLEEQYNQLQTIIDSVAERVRKVGHFAKGSMQEFLNASSLQEHSGAASVSETMLAELVADHDALIRKTRKLIDDFEEKYDDAGSADFITGIMKEHEKMAWMLRASVPQKSAK
jgi:starvation-inducible DNA-binding protein